MAINPSLAAFVSQEFRYEIHRDNVIKTAFSGAQEIEINTNLTELDANALANDLFAETDSFAQAFEVVIEGIVSLDDFDGQVPLYTLESDHYATDNRTLRIVALEVDYLANETKLTVRG